jgi:Ca-activated chloride channel family protein
VSFQWPLALLSLLALPLAALLYLTLQRRPSRHALFYTNLEVLRAAAILERDRRRYLPPALFLLALAASLAALARPHVAVTATRPEADVVLAIDTSGSMFASDVQPTRLGAAQEAVSRFLDRLPARYRVGVVAFSSDVQVVAPLTRDREAAREAVRFLYPGRGTAIGDALARAVELAREGEAGGREAGGSREREEERKRPLAAILLLSDGFQTRGLLQPLEGAERAKQAGIPVYTVALGTPEGTVTFFDQDGVTRTIPVPPDPDTLRAIAEETGGRFFAAASGARLNAVYEGLGSRLGRYRARREATSLFLAAGAALLVLSGLFSARWQQRLP